MSVPVISLLYPAGHAAPFGAGRNTSRTESDLGLPAIIPALDLNGRHSRFIAKVLTELNFEPEVIAYRQQMLKDLLRLPALAEGFTQLLPQLAELASAGRGSGWGDNLPIAQLGSRLAELEHYVNCIEGLWAILETAEASKEKPQAEGLKVLRSFLAETRNEEDYRKLTAELPVLRARLDQAGSITIGINLDANLRPEAATLLSINEGRFVGKSGLLERLLGGGSGTRGLTPLYRALEGKSALPEHELFREMNDLLERVISPVAEALGQYTRINCAPLSSLEPELAFYLGAAKLTRELREAGLALCHPEIAPAEERTGVIKGLYSFDLALRLRTAARHNNRLNVAAGIVPNDLAFGQEATIFILTGPNSGGKTTFTRAVGQSQMLFQAGLLVPGTSARLSPVDAIFTHFVIAERLETEGGRLADELERMAQIFRGATRHSLILLNEPLASTDQISARTLSREILAGLQLLGARTIYVTHLHELVEDSATLSKNGTTGAVIVSLIAEVTSHNGNGKDAVPSYHIRPGLPQSLGYAIELAREYGLSLTQITEALRERGIDK